MKHFIQFFKGGDVDWRREFARLRYLLCNVFVIEEFPWQPKNSLFDVLENVFEYSQFKGTFLSVRDLFEEYIPGWEQEGFKVTKEKFVLFTEIVYNLINEMQPLVKRGYQGLTQNDFANIRNASNRVLGNIRNVLDKIGLEMSVVGLGNKCFAAVEKNFVLDTVLPVHEDISTLVKSYQRESLKGHIDEKRSLLSDILREIEPDLDNSCLKKDYGGTISKIRKIANNLHIRHNNEEGKWGKPAIKSISSSDIERTYDGLFSLIVLLLASKKCAEVDDDINRIMSLVTESSKGK